MTYWNQRAYDNAADAGLPEHERDAIASTPPWTAPWNPILERCTCGATGYPDAPIYSGPCYECDAECCTKCGTVEGDEGGNTNTCPDCLKAEAA